jgi:hypothetical protein
MHIFTYHFMFAMFNIIMLYTTCYPFWSLGAVVFFFFLQLVSVASHLIRVAMFVCMCAVLVFWWMVFFFIFLIHSKIVVTCLLLKLGIIYVVLIQFATLKNCVGCSSGNCWDDSVWGNLPITRKNK